MRSSMRIVTIQRQARELGRLRTGTYEKPATGKGRPVRSNTWILTSHAEHYIEAAAAEWGGKVEKWQPQGNGAQQFRVITKAVSLDGILPPGDPLSQSYELWNRGGCARRCDGITEFLADEPCLCRAQWGEDFHAVAPKDEACKMTTRLNLILPSMPDVGVWRVESHSYYSANEMAAAVDLIRAATGPQALIPVTVRIEQRTRVAAGKTKHFPVIAVELRGSTAGQILAATMAGGQISGAQPAAELGGARRAAIEAAKPNYLAQAQAASTLAAWREIWQAALAAEHLDAALKDQLAPIGQVLKEREEGDSAPAELAEESETVEGEPVDAESELDRLWGLILENAPTEWDTKRVEVEFAKRTGGTLITSADEQQLGAFLQWLQNGGA